MAVIRDTKVVGLMPSNSAAPLGPETFSFVRFNDGLTFLPLQFVASEKLGLRLLARI
jgi:hypothetical protein